MSRSLQGKAKEPMSADRDTFTELVDALRDPTTYPHHPAAVELCQTHISCVFLAGDEVYKIKKPVQFSFLDFSTLERRRHFCHEEVRLNRRLAAPVYLGVVAIVRNEAGFHFADESHPEAIEYAVHMRRLPPRRTLDVLLADNVATTTMIDLVAERLVAFHHEAPTNQTITANGSASGIGRILADNFSNGKPFRNITVADYEDDLIQRATLHFIEANRSLLEQRQAQGRIRDCHGDLHADHICFADQLLIYDCIEFNTQFRYIDVASDIAFLAMDLEFLGRADLSQHFVDHYVELSGDRAISNLLPFYACYRAYVRGKVDSLKSVEPEVGSAERAGAADSARRHFDLAYRYAWSLAPRLIVVMGPSGSGKSTLAEALSQHLGFAHLNSDIIRKQLAGVGLTQRNQDIRGVSLYTPEYSQRTYETMESQALQMLASGRGVVLDATYQHRDERRKLVTRTRAIGKPVVLVECQCDESVLRERLRQRAERDDSASDATWEIYQQQMLGYEPPTSAEADLLVCADTTGGTKAACDRVERTMVESF